MTKITYEIVEHDGGWAYRANGVFSETFSSHDAARKAAERAAKAGAPDVETSAVSGDPVRTLIHSIEQHKADLLVVGNRGLNTLAGRLLGSVPSVVTHRAQCDVLIVATT